MRTFIVVYIIILLGSSTFLKAQDRVEFKDTLNDFDQVLLDNLGNKSQETINQLKSLSSNIPWKLGVFEFKNALATADTLNSKTLSICKCEIKSNILSVVNAVGFMSAGIGSVIEIDLKDSTYQSFLFFETDGKKA